MGCLALKEVLILFLFPLNKCFKAGITVPPPPLLVGCDLITRPLPNWLHLFRLDLSVAAVIQTFLVYYLHLHDFLHGIPQTTFQIPLQLMEFRFLPTGSLENLLFVHVLFLKLTRFHVI